MSSSINDQLRGVQKVELKRERRDRPLVYLTFFMLGMIAFLALVVVALKDAQEYAVSGQSQPPQDGPSVGMDKWDYMTAHAAGLQEEAALQMTVTASEDQMNVRHAEETKTAAYVASQTAIALTPTSTPVLTDVLPNCDKERKKRVERPTRVKCAPYRAAPAPTEDLTCEEGDYTSIVEYLEPCYVMPPTVVPTVPVGMVPTNAPMPEPPSFEATPTPNTTPAAPTHYESGGY